MTGSELTLAVALILAGVLAYLEWRRQRQIRSGRRSQSGRTMQSRRWL